MKYFFVATFLLVLFCNSILHAVSYTATIEGLSDKRLAEEMRQASVTCTSRDKNVPTPITLKLRTSGDVDRLKNVAQNAGFFNCSIRPVVTFSDDNKATVLFQVSLGDPFTLKSLDIIWSDEDIVRSFFANNELEKRQPSFTFVKSFKKGDPATGKRLLAMPEELIVTLRSNGFAFCKIVKNEIVADRSSHQVDVHITVQTGPVVRFGYPVIYGAPHIKEEAFKPYFEWKTGEFYSPKLIEKTESSLQRTGLFQSVQIDEGDSLSDDWMIPMYVRVTEAKQRTISAGISYTTTYGPGVSGGWEHRNIGGLGRKLSAQMQFWEKMRSATLSYTVPNFARDDQNLTYVLEYDQQHYLPFESSMTQASMILDRELTKRMDGTAGIAVERLESKGIIKSELFHLFKTPCQLRWSSANSPLDPTKGVSIFCRLTPSFQLHFPTFSYYIHTTTFSTYQSICQDKITFALRGQIGNIFGASEQNIPLPDRIFAGSDNTLRGYKTGSVSPLNHSGQPVGGRSLLAGTLEARFRTSTHFGWVAFYDIGQVFSQPFPQIQGAHFLHSFGMGLRYQTPIGPLRLDFGIPLPRRSHIDSAFQIYFSIGQAF